MEFHYLVPGKVGKYQVFLGDKIRISFVTRKADGNTRMVLYIGHIIADRLGLEHGKRIKFADCDHPLIFGIKKADDLDPISWTVFNDNKYNSKKFPIYKVQISWTGREIPETCKDGTKFVNYEYAKGGIVLFLPGTTLEDRKLALQSVKFPD